MSDQENKIVVVAQRIQHARENSRMESRTAVFDNNATLQEVFDWVKRKNDRVLSIVDSWSECTITIHEDEITKPKKERNSGFFSTHEEMEKEAQ